MGTYLYGLKKLAKPQRVTREDGAQITLTHFLKYQLKPSFGFSMPNLDRLERLTLGRLDRTYGPTWEGYVLYGDRIIAWRGPGAWYDSAKLPGTVWGVVRSTTGEDERERVEDVRVRLPPMSVTVEEQGRKVEYQLKRVLHVTAKAVNGMNVVINSLNAYAVRLGNGCVEFRVQEHERAVQLPADAEDYIIYNLWQNYLHMTQDWLEENTERPAVAPVLH